MVPSDCISYPNLCSTHIRSSLAQLNSPPQMYAKLNFVSSVLPMASQATKWLAHPNTGLLIHTDHQAPPAGRKNLEHLRADANVTHGVLPERLDSPAVKRRDSEVGPEAR
ncbi:hypothetical protein H0H81_006191 [Sphagnurus paluster]|uniref:Uncharacterized protein n=1 Tax=Sphagnurus paluster TaxID=117069 RepID=A0A9P7FXB7_9AGAR|nr:hypothetical protein H0H81_006191 [Sphagnurus paluster]